MNCAVIGGNRVFWLRMTQEEGAIVEGSFSA